LPLELPELDPPVLLELELPLPVDPEGPQLLPLEEPPELLPPPVDDPWP
jgi:hypothetical protein